MRINVAIVAALALTSASAGAQPLTSLAFAARTTVPLGTDLELATTNANVFVFTKDMALIATPVSYGPAAAGVPNRTAVAHVALCGPTALVTSILGAMSPGLPACMPTFGGRNLAIAIPSGPIGNLLLQRGMPAPSGFWNITVFSAAGPVTRVRGPIQFVPAGYVVPAPPVHAPQVSDVEPKCVDSANSPLTLTASGRYFDPNNAQAIVGYIYFIGPHDRFRYDNNGRDSRITANTIARSSTSITFSIDLQAIHNHGGDRFGLGGNYYVQVRNPNGSISGDPAMFTAKPFTGGRCP